VNRVRQLAVPVQNIGYDQVRRFLTVSPTEFQQAVAGGNASDPVNVFRGVLAKTWTDHRVAVSLYNEQKPLVLMMSYGGTDVVNHLFAPFHPPYREGVDATGYRKYWAAVTNYYAEIDRLIGEWMSVLPADTTVIVMSSHGFRWGRDRPRAVPRSTEALSDHRNPGVFIAYGNHVAASGGEHSATLYDIAPTALAILGLPQSSDMPGHVINWALRDITPVQSVRVVSYAEFTNLRPAPQQVGLEPKAYEAELQAIGHINDPQKNRSPLLENAGEQQAGIAPSAWGSYAYYNNLGISYRKDGKIGEAIQSFARAQELNPSRATPHLNMAMVLLDRQQYTAADEEFLKAIGAGLPNADEWFVDFAAWYRTHAMPTRAIALLVKGREMFPQSPLIAANLGSAMVSADRYTEGVPELERALALQPSSTLALNSIGAYFAKQKDYGRALDFWNRSLTIDPRQPTVRAAAEAARSRL
jgi:tetratricopeptide (TPR) repeat protein